MNHDVVHCNGWNVVFELRPRIAARRRIEHSEFSSHEQQVWLRIILTYHLDRAICWKIPDDRSPVQPVVSMPERILLEIIVAMIVEGRVVHCDGESLGEYTYRAQ